jgi:hypothetical protein
MSNYKIGNILTISIHYSMLNKLKALPVRNINLKKAISRGRDLIRNIKIIVPNIKLSTTRILNN